MKELYIPLPPDNDFDLFIDETIELREEIAHFESELANKHIELRNRFLQLFENGS